MGKAFSTVQVLLPIFEKGTPADRSIAARQAMLATLPLPSGIPDDALQPIMIHPPHTLHEFLGNSSGVGFFRVSFVILTSSSLSRTCEDFLLTSSNCSTFRLSHSDLGIN